MEKLSVVSAGRSVKDFLGEWTVKRVVLDRTSMGRVFFEGSVTIDRDRFDERGEGLFNGYRSSAIRIYRLQSSPGRAIVLFPDGREFIRLDERPVQTVLHHCGADTYRGRFFFLSAVAWIETWQVIGPRKNYRSVTRYQRPQK
jgi:hypothetical protein